jgi:hypothetical protein
VPSRVRVIPDCRAPPSRVLGPRADLRAAVVENDYARADEFCAPPENPAGFDIFDNSREAKSIVQRLGNPMMLLRDIAEVNSRSRSFLCKVPTRSGAGPCKILGRGSVA